ncbi:unnamed protein product, partial [Meganyctiphanes norvegica]
MSVNESYIPANNSSGCAPILVVPDDVAWVRWLAYQVILSIFICIGCITNGFCIYVTYRPNMKQLYLNSYIRVISASDFITCLLHIPWTTTYYKSCIFDSYATAFYRAYFGTTLPSFTRSFTLCMVLWISYDRLIAMWSFKKFQHVKTNNVILIRLLGTFMYCLFACIPLWVYASVDCVGDSHNLLWMSNGGYVNNIHTNCFLIIRSIRDVLFRVLPNVLLVVFGVGLIVAVAKKIQDIKGPTMNQSSVKGFHHTIMVLSINISYILSSLPLIIGGLFFFRRENGECFGTATSEAWTAFGVLLRSFWHDFGVFFIIAL